MENSFAPHVPTNQSKLEQWRSEIQQMRAANWPYHKIAQWLLNEKGCHAHKDTIRKFCLVRKIKKGTDTQAPKQKPPSKSKLSSSAETKIFSYGEEESGRPIEIKRK